MSDRLSINHRSEHAAVDGLMDQFPVKERPQSRAGVLNGGAAIGKCVRTVGRAGRASAVSDWSGWALPCSAHPRIKLMAVPPFGALRLAGDFPAGLTVAGIPVARVARDRASAVRGNRARAWGSCAERNRRRVARDRCTAEIFVELLRRQARNAAAVLTTRQPGAGVAVFARDATCAVRAACASSGFVVLAVLDLQQGKCEHVAVSTFGHGAVRWITGAAEWLCFIFTVASAHWRGLQVKSSKSRLGKHLIVPRAEPERRNHLSPPKTLCTSQRTKIWRVRTRRRPIACVAAAATDCAGAVHASDARLTGVVVAVRYALLKTRLRTARCKGERPVRLCKRRFQRRRRRTQSGQTCQWAAQ